MREGDQAEIVVHVGDLLHVGQAAGQEQRVAGSEQLDVVGVRFAGVVDLVVLEQGFADVDGVDDIFVIHIVGEFTVAAFNHFQVGAGE